MELRGWPFFFGWCLLFVFVGAQQERVERKNVSRQKQKKERGKKNAHVSRTRQEPLGMAGCPRQLFCPSRVRLRRLSVPHGKSSVFGQPRTAFRRAEGSRVCSRRRSCPGAAASRVARQHWRGRCTLSSSCLVCRIGHLIDMGSGVGSRLGSPSVSSLQWEPARSQRRGSSTACGVP